MATNTTARGEFSMGWKVLLAALIGVACGASPLPFNTIGFVLEPINKEFGWGFGAISGAVMVYGITGVLLAPVLGWMADKYGVRNVAMGSTLTFAITFALVGAAPSAILGFYLMCFLVGLVGIGSTPVTWSRAVNLWFFKNRGRALGIMPLGTSISALTVPRLAVWAIGEFGWRGMYLVVALLPLLVALPIAFFCFREPRRDEMPAGIRAGGDVLVCDWRGAAFVSGQISCVQKGRRKPCKHRACIIAAHAYCWPFQLFTISPPVANQLASRPVR